MWKALKEKKRGIRREIGKYPHSLLFGVKRQKVDKRRDIKEIPAQ